MQLFRRKNVRKPYDPQAQVPILRCSICTGEQTAGFCDRASGRFQEVMMIRTPEDLDRFREEYGITGPIRKEY